MARDLSGTDQSIRSDNGVSGIDVDAFTMSVCVNVDAGTGGIIFMTASAISGGNSAGSIAVVAPAVADWRMNFSYRFSTTSGDWRYDTDLLFGRWYHVLVTYDRSNVANNPRMWIDGSEVTLTELTTPVGTAKSGVDSVILGENVGFGQDLDGKLAEAACWSRIVNDNEAAFLTSRFSPEFALSGLEAYWDLIRKLNDRIQGVGLIDRGDSLAFDHLRMIYPAPPMIVTAPAAAANDLLLLEYSKLRGGLQDLSGGLI